MIFDYSQFSTKIIATCTPTIHIIDGPLMHVSYVGTIRIPSLSIFDAYHVQSSSYSLLFLSQLCDLGLELQFFSHGCEVHDAQIGWLI